MNSAYEENGLPRVERKNKDVKIVGIGNNVKSREIIDMVIDDMQSFAKSETMAKYVKISRLKSLINTTPDLSIDGVKNETLETDIAIEVKIREELLKSEE